MSVLKSYFNQTVNQNSPVFDDIRLVEKVDKDGGIIMVPEKTDLREIQKSHGYVDDWSLTNLMKAGIDPGSLSIHTGYTTRLDGVDAINVVASEIDASLNTNDNTVLTNSVFDNTNKNDE